MPRPRPLLLLPPSKGKAEGGRGRVYGRTLRARHPLTAARRETLAAVTTDVAALDDAALARVAGVAGRDVDAARDALLGLADAPTLPAHRRYTGVVHGNAGLADRDPAAGAADVRLVSPLLGLVALDEPVPAYRLELTGRLPSLGGLGPFWRDALADHLGELGGDRPVWDLLPGEHRRVWTASVRADLDVVDVRFLRPDGRAANAARTKVAKGRLAAALLDGAPVEPAALARETSLGEGWTLAADGEGLVATWTG